MSGHIDDFTFFETPPTPLTREWVREGVERIRKQPQGAASGYELRLRTMVLRAIAGGWCAAPMECAREALRTETFHCSRWPISA